MSLMQTKNKVILLAVVLALIVIIVAVGVNASGSSKKADAPSEERAAGVTYLQSLEQQDPNEIDAVLKQQRDEKLRAEREERIRKLTDGEVSVWSMFEDYAIIGDSRAVGFSAYEFLPEERILAKVGVNLSYVSQITEDLKHLNPRYVFICFGVNDMEMHPDDIPGFCDSFREGVKKIREVCPDAEIYVNSVLRVSELGASSARVLGEITEYNEALKELCGEIDCWYIDNDNLYEKHGNLFDADGIHFLPDIYPFWGANMIMATFDAQVNSQNSEDSQASEDLQEEPEA